MVIRAALIGLLAIALGACSGSSLTNEERAVLETLSELPNDAMADMTDDELACVEDGLEAEGLTGNEILSDGTGESLVVTNRIVYECVPDLFDRDSYVAQNAASFALGTGVDVEVSVDEMKCLLKGMEAETADPIGVLFDPDPDQIALLLELMRSCFSEEFMVAFDGAGQGSVGDDESLDALAGLCEGGDVRSCDLLYLLSAEGSGYEGVATACGGRTPAESGWCSPGLGAVDGVFYETGSVEALAVRADCESGDWIACDLLFNGSPPGSDDENFGFTCGHRIATGGIPDCRTRLG